MSAGQPPNARTGCCSDRRLDSLCGHSLQIPLASSQVVAAQHTSPQLLLPCPCHTSVGINCRSSQTGDAYRVPEPGAGGGIFKQGSGGFFSNPLFHPFGNIAQSIHGNNPAPAQPSRAAGQAAAGQQPGTSARSPVPPGGIVGAPGRLVMQQQAKNAAELSLSTVLGGQGTVDEGRTGRGQQHNFM